MRCAGKDYEEYYRRARNFGIIFLKGLVGKIDEDPLTKNLIVQFEPVGTDTLVKMEVHMVVLSSGSLPSKGTDEIAKVLNMEKSPDGFLKEFHARLASSAGIPMGKGEYVMELIRATPSDERCAKCYKCIEACPYSAISINEAGSIVVDIIKCRGCGTYAAICPSKAIDLTHYKDEQYVVLIDELLPIEE